MLVLPFIELKIAVEVPGEECQNRSWALGSRLSTSLLAGKYKPWAACRQLSGAIRVNHQCEGPIYSWASHIHSFVWVSNTPLERLSINITLFPSGRNTGIRKHSRGRTDRQSRCSDPRESCAFVSRKYENNSHLMVTVVMNVGITLYKYQHKRGFFLMNVQIHFHLMNLHNDFLLEVSHVQITASCLSSTLSPGKNIYIHFLLGDDTKKMYRNLTEALSIVERELPFIWIPSTSAGIRGRWGKREE